MNTNSEQLSKELEELKNKIQEYREIIKPLQKRKVYLSNRIATIKVRESIQKKK